MTRGKSRSNRLRYVKLHIDDLHCNEQNINEDQTSRYNLLIVKEQIFVFQIDIVSVLCEIIRYEVNAH